MKMINGLSALILIVLVAPLWANPSQDAALRALTDAKSNVELDLDKAEQYIETALELAPDNAEVQFTCGRIMGRQAGEAIFSALSYAKKSLACFERAVALQPDQPRYQSGLMIYYLSAPPIAGGSRDLAWAQVDVIADIDPLQGVLAKLDFYQHTEQQSQYQQTLAEGLKTYPDSAAMHFLHGLQLQRTSQYAEAMIAFSAATQGVQGEEDPYQFNAWYQKGRTAVIGAESPQQGIDALLFYIDNAPDLYQLPAKPWAHLRVAQLYQQLQQTELAQMHMEKARVLEDKTLQEEVRKLQKAIKRTSTMAGAL